MEQFLHLSLSAWEDRAFRIADRIPDLPFTFELVLEELPSWALPLANELGN